MGGFYDAMTRRRATEFLAFIDTLPNLTVQPFDAAELSKVRKTLVRFNDQTLTLADAHGLVIMQGRRNVICWSTDRHLGLTGADLAIIC
jgi:hypothetical protein